MNVTELRPGNYFLDEGNLYQVIDILLNKTAMRKMVAKVKCKNLRTGAIIEIARNSGYDVEKTSISKNQTCSEVNVALDSFIRSIKNHSPLKSVCKLPFISEIFHACL